MKKIQISSLPETQSLGTFKTIGIDAAGLSTTMRNVGDIEGSKVFSDANTIHTLCPKRGLFIFLVYGEPLNVPTDGKGSILHFQRIDGSDVSASQMIMQIAFGDAKTYIRNGVGNGTNITFTSWREI